MRRPLLPSASNASIQTVTAAHPPQDVTVESALRAALEVRGRDLIDRPALLRAFLERRCSDAPHDVASVLTGIDAQVPQVLADARDDDRRAIARALEKRLRDRHGMNRYAAAWTVRTWAKALGVTVPAGAASL